MKRKTLEIFEMRVELADDMGPGSMTEYGWWDKEIEDGIAEVMERMGVDRVEAIVFYFNNL